MRGGLAELKLQVEMDSCCNTTSTTLAIETGASRNPLPVDAPSDGDSRDPLYMDKGNGPSQE